MTSDGQAPIGVGSRGGCLGSVIYGGIRQRLHFFWSREF